MTDDKWNDILFKWIIASRIGMLALVIYNLVVLTLYVCGFFLDVFFSIDVVFADIVFSNVFLSLMLKVWHVRKKRKQEEDE